MSPYHVVNLKGKGAKVKLPSGLPVLSRKDPISAHTMTRSKAHILVQEREAGEAPA